MAFLDSNLHTRLAIVTVNELGLAFPPRNLPKKFRPDPSTFYLVIVVGYQTDRQTNAGDSIIPRFHGDKKSFSPSPEEMRAFLNSIAFFQTNESRRGRWYVVYGFELWGSASMQNCVSAAAFLF